MYVDVVPNRNSRPAILLREGWREGKRIRKRTIANLTEWPKAKVEALRRLLRDEPLMAPSDVFVVQRTLPHGHVEAVLGTIHQLELDRLIASKRCRERDLVIAMIAEQLIHPSSKLGTTRLWHTTTLAQELGVVDADEDDSLCGNGLVDPAPVSDRKEAGESTPFRGCTGALRCEQ